MKVAVGPIIFECAYRSDCRPEMLFTLTATDNGPSLERPLAWMADWLHIDNVVLEELWTIMYENDEEGLVMWKLTHEV